MFVWYGFRLANVIASTWCWWGFLVGSKSSAFCCPVPNLLHFHLSLSTLLPTAYVGADPQLMWIYLEVLIPTEKPDCISLMDPEQQPRRPTPSGLPQQYSALNLQFFFPRWLTPVNLFLIFHDQSAMFFTWTVRQILPESLCWHFKSLWFLSFWHLTVAVIQLRSGSNTQRPKQLQVYHWHQKVQRNTKGYIE